MDAAKLGEGLARPSMLLLLLYGLLPLVGGPMSDCRPRILPLLNDARRSGCARKLRLRATADPGLSEELDERDILPLPSGCKICCCLIAVYISLINMDQGCNVCLEADKRTLRRLSSSLSHSLPYRRVDDAVDFASGG